MHIYIRWKLIKWKALLQLHLHVFMHYSVYCRVVTCTFTFVLLSEYAMHELTAHLTEGGAKEGVLLETMRHINLETLLEKLYSGRGAGTVL